MNLIENDTNILNTVLKHLVKKHSHEEIQEYFTKDKALKWSVPYSVLNEYASDKHYLELMSVRFSCGEKCNGTLIAHLTLQKNSIEIELTRSGLTKVYQEYKTILENSLTLSS